MARPNKVVVILHNGVLADVLTDSKDCLEVVMIDTSESDCGDPREEEENRLADTYRHNDEFRRIYF